MYKYKLLTFKYHLLSEKSKETHKHFQLKFKLKEMCEICFSMESLKELFGINSNEYNDSNKLLHH